MAVGYNPPVKITVDSKGVAKLGRHVLNFIMMINFILSLK